MSGLSLSHKFQESEQAQPEPAGVPLWPRPRGSGRSARLSGSGMPCVLGKLTALSPAHTSPLEPFKLREFSQPAPSGDGLEEENGGISHFVFLRLAGGVMAKLQPASPDSAHCSALWRS